MCSDFRISFRSVNGLMLLLLASSLLVGACKSERRFGERKPVAQAYHNFTSHYNGYFNANELIVLAEEEVAKSRELDYNELLPIYPAYSAKNVSGVTPSLDKAMEKVSMVVNIHRPSSYEDDSYLLLGKAQLLKQDYESAEHTFEWAVKDFDPANETARLRRIEKKKIADGKARSKASRQKSKGRSTAPQRARPAPKAKKKRSTAPKAKGGKKKAKSSSKSSSSKKSDSAKKGKPKTRAEMAKEQRERRLEEEKALAKAEEDKIKAQQEAQKKAEQAEQERLNALAKGVAPDANSALNDGQGLAAPTTSDQKPKSGPFVHEPALQDLNFWLARTYITREKYIEAERTLGKLARSGATLKEVRRQLPAAYAELYMKREKYAEAIPYLEDAIALTKRRKDKARYAYIKGQLHQLLGESQAAYAEFGRVIKLKPDFEMVFNAELNRATTAYKTGNSSIASTIKELTRMSKEDKYAEYRDQVFFKMADISLDAGNREEGISYLHKGLAANQGNQRLAARAYLKLGNLYFEDESYVLASNYFDSTLQVLPKDDVRYAEVEEYRNNLKPIAENLLAIALQDSLQALAALSPEEQQKVAAKIEQDAREAARQKAIAATKAAAQNTAAKSARRPAGGATQTQSTFFAYDEKSKKRAAKAFERRWGDRPLGDNWRTTDSRESTAASENVVEEVVNTAVSEEELTEILKDVPNDETALANSNKIIENAYMSLGRQYRDKLQNAAKAAEALEELMRRYPSSEYTAEALYLVALAYDELGRTADAKAARSRLVKEFPSTNFAKAITDPDFLASARDENMRLAAYFDETYELFEKNQAEQALVRINAVPTEFGEEHEMKPRFALLKALVVGKIEGKDPYIEELRKVVSTYPSSDESTRAKEILRLLGERAGTAGSLDKAAATGGDKPAVDANFSLDPETSHYFLAVLPKGVSMSKAKAGAADYNEEFHRLDKLAIGNVYMMSSGEQTPVIVIRRFKNQGDAMNYYAGVSGNKATFLKGDDFTPLVISQNNYREVLRSKSFAEYMKFFEENYL